MNELPKELLTDDEVEKLLMQTLKFHHNNPLTEEELDECSPKIIEWANRARLDAIMLDLVLKNNIAIGLNKNGEIAFRALSKQDHEAKPRIAEIDEDDPEDEDPSDSWKNGNYDPSAAFLSSLGS